MRLFTNGAPSVSCRPLLQAGDAKAVKSPAFIAAVGTKAVWSSGFCVSSWPAGHEEEQFVAHERAAEGSAQLVALEAVLAPGQEVRFVETAVAHELEQAAVHRVGAGFRHGVHGGAGANSAACFLTPVTSRNSCSASGNGRCMPVPSKLFR